MKRMLLVKASDDVCADEIEHIENVCQMFGIEHNSIELTQLDGFQNQVADLGKFDFLYVGAHADTFGFGEATGNRFFGWAEFGIVLCSANCLCPEAILLLGCCRGGLKMVAMKLFRACPKIDYISGPRWTVTAQDITTAFHVFLYNIEIRREQPSTASMRASQATGYDFYYYDRVEIEDTVSSRVAEALLEQDLGIQEGSDETPT
jgi:hypothetical protein